MINRLFFSISFLLFVNLANAQQLSTLLKLKGHFRKDTLIKIGNGNEMEIPAVVLKGAKQGPTIAIIAGLHGYEYVPIMASQKFLTEVELKKLSGTIILLPIANMPSFYGRAMGVNPLDSKNPNREFPGKPNGTITEVFANWITQNVIKNVDVFLDMHGGDGQEDLASFACFYNRIDKPEQTQLAKELCEASGLTNIVSYPYNLKEDEQSHYAFKEVVQQGKVGFSLEVGGLGKADEEDVQLNKEAIFNTLVHLKMYGRPVEKLKKLDYYNNQNYISATENGILYSNLKAGEAVQKGQKLGSIKDEFGKVKTEIVAPVSGIILYKVSTPPVNRGESIFCIGIN